MIVLAPPLDAISQGAQPYPAYLLREGSTGLALFAAAFLGVNDSIHFARQEMTCTCVDSDADRLDKMADLYPVDWDFVFADAWEFAQASADGGSMWDVVSVDTFTGGSTKRSLASLDLWCSLSTETVTATLVDGQTYDLPEGWNDERFHRARNIYWLVLRREESA